jgi:hypothetical protein
VQERVHEKSYTWHFETSMQVDKRQKSEYLGHLPEEQFVPQTPAGSDDAEIPRSEPPAETGDAP